MSGYGNTGNIVTTPLVRSVLSDALRAWRQREHLTVEAAADELGVSSNTYKFWEYRRTMANTAHLARIADRIGVDMRDLVGDET